MTISISPCRHLCVSLAFLALQSAIALLLSPSVLTADDVVVLKGGDRLHGEIKSLSSEVLTLDTDYADEVFKIKWEEVVRIESDQRFAIETFGGERLSGKISESDPDIGEGKQVFATDTGDAKEIGLAEVSELNPVDETVWSRFDGGFTGGSSFTKANSARQFNVGANVEYRSDRNLLQENFDILFNSQGGGETAIETRRWESNSQYQRFIGNRWYAIGAVNFLRSSEQQLDLRRTVQGGVGRYLFRTNAQYLAVGGGLAWANERYEDSEEPPFNSAEAWGGFEFYTEKLGFADYYTRYGVFPSLTRSGRVRMSLSSYLKFNLPGDWDFKVSFYDNFDSSPVVDGAQRNDYGVVTSFGWQP